MGELNQQTGELVKSYECIS